MKEKIIAGLWAIAVVVTGLAGCGNRAETAASTTVNSTGGAETPIHVVVAGTPTYAPYTYVGEVDKETGFDIEVLREIDKIAPEIECEFTYSEWDTLMPGLDARRFDVICNQLGKTAEREAKYYFEELPFSCNGGMIITNKKYKDGTGWESLKGAKVECITGSSFAKITEDWLAAHPGTFETVYTENSLAQVLEDIVEGKADATLEDPAVARQKAAANGFENSIYVINNAYASGLAYYMFAQTDKGKEIAAIVDKYLPVLYYEGTLAKLAKEFLGSDASITELPTKGFYKEATLDKFQAAHSANNASSGS